MGRRRRSQKSETRAIKSQEDVAAKPLASPRNDPPAREVQTAEQLGLDDATYRMLCELQNRDIRPEDYDLLSRLDESVKPKTLDVNQLQHFPTFNFSRESASADLAQHISCNCS